VFGELDGLVEAPNNSFYIPPTIAPGSMISGSTGNQKT
jgi:hypothetical protein